MFKGKFVLLCLFTIPLFMATPVSAVGSIPEPHAIRCDNGGTEPSNPVFGQSFTCVNDNPTGVTVNWYGKDLPTSLTLTVTYNQAPDRCDTYWNYYDDTFDGIQGSCTISGNTATISYPQLPTGIPDSQTPKVEIINFSQPPSPSFTAVIEGTLYDPDGGGSGPASIQDNVQIITDSVTADDEANDNIKNQDTTGDDYSLNSDHNQSLLTFLVNTIQELASVKPASNCDFDLPQPTQINPSGTKFWRVDVCTYNPPGSWTTVLSAISAFFWLMAIYNLLQKVLQVNREAVE